MFDFEKMLAGYASEAPTVEVVSRDELGGKFWGCSELLLRSVWRSRFRWEKILLVVSRSYNETITANEEATDGGLDFGIFSNKNKLIYFT